MAKAANPMAPTQTWVRIVVLTPRQVRNSMNTILLTWNPKHFPWKSLPEQAAKVQAGTKVLDEWNCYKKDVPIGTRLFLLMQAKGKKGIVASGHSVTHTKIGPHWIPKKADLGITRRYIGL